MILSIVIPVYNKEEFLPKCFDSLLSQFEGLFEDVEIIVVNDGSTDSSWDIIQSYKKYFQNFIVINQKNSGVSIARNNGIDQANGKFILFLDADDEINHNTLSLLVEYIRDHLDADMIVTKQIKRFNGKDSLVALNTLSEDKVYSGVSAFKKGYIRTNAGGGLCRTDFLRSKGIRFPSGIKNAEDSIFFAVVQSQCQSILFLNLPLYIINVYPGSVSRTDSTTLALRHVNTVNAILEIRSNLSGITNEQLGIIDFMCYQIISNTISHFIDSDKLTYKDFISLLKPQFFPNFNIDYIPISKMKINILNKSYTFFYFLDWVKVRLKR